MTAETYEIRECTNCRLRYPLVAGHPFGEGCPICRGETRVVLRRELVTEPVASTFPQPLGRVEALLDNIRSAWNVGSIFRSADGFQISHLHLCGITPTPEFDGVRKTALGAEQTISWTYYRNALEAAHQLKGQGKQLWALEYEERSMSISDLEASTFDSPIVLIAGNEITGVDAEILEQCDRIVSIPMRGNKRSFNVAVAFGIAAYALQAAQGPRR